MKLKFLGPAVILIPLVWISPAKAENRQALSTPLYPNFNLNELILAQADANSSSLSLGQAADIISRWLEAKTKIFAPPYDVQALANLTTGVLYTDTLKAVNYLKNNNGYYRYGVQKVESVDRFAASGNKATIEVRVTEDVTLYQNGKVDNSSFNTKLVRYTLEYWDGNWKIADSQVIY